MRWEAEEKAHTELQPVVLYDANENKITVRRPVGFRLPVQDADADEGKEEMEA